jgi:hypothetical protein
MNSQELRALQEAYMEVYELDEDKRPIYGRGGDMRRTETPLQIYGKQATAKDKRTKHNIPKGGTTIDKRDPDELFSGDYDRGSGNAAKRRAAALTKPEEKKFPNRLTRSDKQGIKDSYDLYDIILSHLLDEGYADTEQAAEAIMVNMSEDWRESICEAAKDQSDKQIEKGVKTTYRAQNVLDNQHQGRSRGLNRLPSDERGDKTKRMRGRLKTRRDDLFGERNRREDESRAEFKKKYGI